MEHFFNYSLIFLGDTHGFIDDFKKQKEIIEKANLEFVLCEQLQDLALEDEESYASFYRDKKKLTKFKELLRLIKLCGNRKIKLVGIDLPDFGFNSRLKSIINGKIKPTAQDKADIKDILKKRTTNHIKMINHYQSKSAKPLLVIIGTWHLRENSEIMKYFNNYAVIYPADSKGRLLAGPTKSSKIIYFERIKNEQKSKA